MFDINKMCIREVTTVPQPTIKVVPTETPCSESMIQGVITRMQNMFGIELAGYFNVDANLRDRDAVIRIFYKGHALGVGVSKTVDGALDQALHTTILPTLKTVKNDLDHILSKLELEVNDTPVV